MTRLKQLTEDLKKELGEAVAPAGMTSADEKLLRLAWADAYEEMTADHPPSESWAPVKAADAAYDRFVRNVTKNPKTKHVLNFERSMSKEWVKYMKDLGAEVIKGGP